jgi:hypothetical protein
MFKLILIATTLALVLTAKNFITPTQKVQVTPENVFIPTDKPIAIVKYKDMIYHCQGIIKTKCGHSLHCGNMSVHCVTDIQVEYLQ